MNLSGTVMIPLPAAHYRNSALLRSTSRQSVTRELSNRANWQDQFGRLKDSVMFRGAKPENQSVIFRLKRVDTLFYERKVIGWIWLTVIHRVVMDSGRSQHLIDFDVSYVAQRRLNYAGVSGQMKMIFNHGERFLVIRQDHAGLYLQAEFALGAVRVLSSLLEPVPDQVVFLQMQIDRPIELRQLLFQELDPLIKQELVYIVTAAKIGVDNAFACDTR